MNQNASDLTKKFVPVERQFEGHRVSVTPFMARKGLNLQLRLVKILGPAIKDLITTDVMAKIKSGEKNFELPIEKLISAVESVLTGPNSDTLYSLIIELLSNSSVNGTNLTEEMFDVIFAKEYILIYKILFFVLEVNFADLLKMGNIGSQQAE